MLVEVKCPECDKKYFLDVLVKGKRFRVQEGDSIRIQYVKILISYLRYANEILKDTQLEEFDRRLKALEEV